MQHPIRRIRSFPLLEFTELTERNTQSKREVIEVLIAHAAILAVGRPCDDGWASGVGMSWPEDIGVDDLAVAKLDRLITLEEDVTGEGETASSASVAFG